MRPPRPRVWYHLFLTALIGIALCTEFISGFGAATSVGSYVEEFFSYFTILSNIFIAGVYIYESLCTLRGTPLPKEFDAVRGAAVFYIIITGVVYTLFLRGPGGHFQVHTSILWVTSIFHYIIPPLTALDWVMFPPQRRLNWSTLLTWIGGTMIYVILVEAGGLLSKTYPYFFLDPSVLHGYFGIFKASAGFLPFFIVFGAFVIGTANLQTRRREKNKSQYLF